MPLTPEKIAEMDALTGFKTPANLGRKSRADEIRSLVQPTQPIEKRESVASKIAGDIKKRGENVYKEITADQNPIASGIKATAEGFNALGDVASDVLTPALKTAKENADKIFGGNPIYDTAKKAVKTGIDTAEKVKDAVVNSDTFASLGDKVNKFVESNPELAKNIETILESGKALGDISTNILGAEGAKAGMETVAKVAPTMATDTFNATRQGVDQVIQKVDDIKSIRASKNAIRDAATLDEVSGQVFQGKKADIPKVKQALSTIDTDGIKTYADLKGALDSKIKTISSKLDDALLTDPTPRKLQQWALEEKVGDTKVVHNYVKDAINHLEEAYKTANDPVSLEKLRQLKVKIDPITGKGITIKEVNDLAREYGVEFKNKAFAKTGEALTSVNAQAFENTRKGIKETARSRFGNEVFDAADEQLSSLIKTKDLVTKMEESVQKLEQRITKRGLGEKVGRVMFQVADKLTGGGLKGFIQSFVPRGEGLKLMNALDLEKNLEKNLKKIQTILDSSGSATEADIIRQLEEIVNQ
jgi:hypothetical protein